MYCLLIKTLRLLIIFYVIFFSSCKKNEENNYFFSGVVTDQVTGQTISGASVSLVSQLFCEVNKPLSDFGPKAISSGDGKFKISIPIETYDYQDIRYGCLYLNASKTGYVGSLKVSAPPLNTDNLNIKLLHYGKLNLHIKNDTINNTIDSMEIWISRWPFFNYTHEYSKICRGRKFDEIILFDSLWSATSYRIQIGPIGRSILSILRPYFESSIIINPDIITDYSVTF
jgi:hypothetical protein